MRIFLLLLLAASALTAGAATLRWSSQGDYLSADPHAQNEGLNNNINDYVYERLTARGKALELIPGLATSWESRGPRVWVFHLRRGVRFHDGGAMSADDVVFSILRAQSASSNFKTFAAPLGQARAIDAHTVEIETPSPMP